MIRFVLLSVAALGSAIVLLAIGFQATDGLVRWQMSRLGIEQLFVSSPDEPFAVSLRHAVAFALPIVVAWGATLLHHLRRPPVPVVVFAAYAGIAVAVFAVVLLLPMLLMRSVEIEAGGIQPMLSLSNLMPSTQQLAFGFMLASVPCVLLALRWSSAGRSMPPRDAGASSTPAP